MKKVLALLLLAGTAVLSGAQALPEQLEPRNPRRISVGTKPVLEMVKDGKVNFEIVVPSDAAPSAKFAGKEAAALLGKAFGAALKVLNAPSGKRPAIIIGSPGFAAKLGEDVNKFDRDGFVIKTFPRGVLIVGRDDPQKPEKVILADHATIFGTYDFLERFAGMRFYVPGDYGTVIPRRKTWSLPEINIYERPDFYQRLYSDWGGDPGTELRGFARKLNELRHRYQTRNIYQCHALRELNFGTRFGKTHPEYFALGANGKRIIDTGFTGEHGWDESHFCYLSGIKEEIIADAVSYLKGEPASVRGVVDRRTRKVGWFPLAFPAGGKFFSISPPDGVKMCNCPRCSRELKGTKEQKRDHYWGFFRDVALTVKKSGVYGYLTVPSNYGLWGGLPPSFQIPDNLILSFGMRGPWSELTPSTRDRQMAELKAWAGKGRGKLLLWTYPGKYYNVFPGIPASTPRHSGTFLKRVRPYALGCYFESYSDRLFFIYLDFYVWGKILWNPETDVEQLLNEHHALLFGPAAELMKEFFDSIERNWMKMAGNTVDTTVGPITRYPSETEMWNTVYSPAERKRLTALFDKAEQLTAKMPEYLARVKTLRREMWLPALKRAEEFSGTERAIARWGAYMAETEKPPVIDGRLDDPAWKRAEVITLIPKKAPVEVRTTVRTLRDKDHFYFGFECEDKGTPETVVRAFDNRELWKDAGVEVFLSPDKSRDRCYQLMVNASGSVADLVCVKGMNDWSWNSKATVKSVITPGKGWITEIKIPRSSLPGAAGSGMLANLTRRYTPPEKKGIGYIWGPFYEKSNSEIDHFGTLRFRPEPGNDLMKDGDFDREPDRKPPRFLGAWVWNGGDEKFPVVRDYLVKGKYAACLDSARFDRGGSCAIHQRPPLKPDTEYELTFFMKLEKVKPAEASFSGFYLRLEEFGRKARWFPHRSAAAFSGTMPWTPVSFRFRTSKAEIPGKKIKLAFTLRKATGKVWIDHVRLVEVKK